MKTLTTEQIGKALRALPEGGQLTVGTAGERRIALVLAKGLGIKIHTKKEGQGQFTIWKLG